MLRLCLQLELNQTAELRSQQTNKSNIPPARMNFSMYKSFHHKRISWDQFTSS